MVLDIPSGILAERVGLGRVTLLSLIGLGGGALLSAFAWDYNALLAGRILQGACTALFQTSAVVAIVRYSDSSERGKALSTYWGFTNTGLSIGPALGGIIASQTDLRMPFVGYAVAALMGIVLLQPVFREKAMASSWGTKTGLTSSSSFEVRKLRDSIWKSCRPLLNNASFTLVLFTSFVFFFARSGVGFTIAPLMGYYSLGFDVITVGVVLTLSTFAMIASMVPLGAYSDKAGRRVVTELSLVFLLVSLILLPFSTDIVTFSLFMGLFGLSLGPMGSLSAWVTDLLEHDSWGTGIGVHRFVQDLGMAVGPLVLSLFVAADLTPSGSLIPPSSFNQSFLISLVLVFAAAFATWRTRDPISKKPKLT